MLPRDALPLVLLLLLLKHQLCSRQVLHSLPCDAVGFKLTDKQLLQLLIAVVDAELLEAVLPEDLEAIDVKDPDDDGVWHVGVCGGQ